MIFVTVGTQLPFPRLMNYMRNWQRKQAERVVFQTCARVGSADPDVYQALSGDQYQTFLDEARVVISHAGIGSVISARRSRTPIILVPRQVGFHEHRNGHQMATAAALEGRTGVRIAWKVDQIPRLLDQRIEVPLVERSLQQDQLVDCIRRFVVS